MDTNMDREELTGGADALQTLIIDIEDLVDWASESTGPKLTREWRDACTERWAAFGILGVLTATVALALRGGRR
jgi:hypothetical protein